MKKYIALFISTTVLLVAPFFAAQASTTRPEIEVEQVRTKYPVPQEVTWETSTQAEDGDETIDYFQLTITDPDTEDEICVVNNIDADALSVTINKSNCPDMKVYFQYTASLLEYYTSGKTSSEGTDSFRTAPSKLKKVRTPKKKLKANTVRVKFNRGVNVSGISMYIDYVVARKNNKKKIVANGADYTRGNYIDIDDLPAGSKLRVRTRLRSSSYGTGPYSAWKVFKTKSDK